MSKSKMHYLNVSSFAREVGVSRQSIYNWLETLDKQVYSEIVTEDNGRKIAESAVGTAQKFFRKTADIAEETEEEGTEETAESENEALRVQAETIAALNNIIVRQEEELKSREAQIAEKDKQIAEYAAKFADIAQGALQTSVQAQMLHAASESARMQNDAQGASGSVTEDNTEPKRRTLWEIITGKRRGE